MNRLNIFLLLVIFILLSFVRSDRASEKDFVEMKSQTFSPTPTPTPTTAPPVRFIIPKILVDAPVIPVSVDAEGKMELPPQPADVGWYQLGVKPGEKGNAVVAGHLDSATGAGAIFGRLSELVPGDAIIVTKEDNQQEIFEVVQKEIFPFDQVPIDMVFGESEERNLNLITCTGVFNQITSNYSHRMIIFAQKQ